MRISVFLSGAFAFALANPVPASAQALRLEDVLARARARAPEVIAALARVDEARAQLLGVSPRLRDNPVLEVAAGPRTGAGDVTLDWSVGAAQSFETGGQRRARIDAAEADVTRAIAAADDVSRTVTRDVALAFVRVLAADERIRLLQGAEAVANELQSATERRYQAGDIAALDLNLTRIAAARAHTDRISAEAARTEALRPVRIVIGDTTGTSTTLTGPLDRAPAPRATLVAAIEQAPALRQASAELARAEADLRLGQALARPDVNAGLSVRREQDDHIISGGVIFTLPVFQSGQGTRAEAVARRQRVTLEREAVRRVLETEIDTGLAIYELRRAAADVLRTTAIPAADDNETLATRSLEAGEMSLLNYLLVRQDVTATRLAYIDALADAAAAAIEVDAAAGVLR